MLVFSFLSLLFFFLDFFFLSPSLKHTRNMCAHTCTRSSTCCLYILPRSSQHFSFLGLMENVATGLDHNEIQVGDLAVSMTPLELLLSPSCSPSLLLLLFSSFGVIINVFFSEYFFL